METKTLYHYTSLATAVEFILPSMRLILNPIIKTNDPRENKPFSFMTFVERKSKNYTQDQILAETINLHSDYLFFSKLSDWESEHEYRLIYFSKTSRDQYCSIRKSLKSIYLGVDFNFNYLPSIDHLTNRIELYKLHFSHDKLRPKRIIYKNSSR